MQFHRRCGDRVTLLNENSTAIRNFVEFNHGLILSAEPIKDDVIFEVCIDRKINVWNGSLEIGVTTLDPEYMELPATATKLRKTAWILSGSSIVKDGITLVNPYGPELDSLREGDCIGVTRTNKAELLFYVNGRCLGVAARDLPTRLFAVIDLYGQCVQVSIMQTNTIIPNMDSSGEQVEEDPNNDDSLTEGDICEGTPVVSEEPLPKRLYPPMLLEGPGGLEAQERIRFHPRCGILVKLSANNKSAERARPLDDYNNGVVMTHRHLYENELFEIRIDRLVDKWSGSIEVGVTTHNPSTIRFPSTMTNMESGTIMMSGCKVLLNGHGTCIEYGNFNLDELKEGDTVGMMRRSNGKLHYFINGVDQGVAADKVEQQLWGVVDLYGMTVKVSIVDPCEDIESNVPLNIPGTPEPSTSRCRPDIDEDSLLFHTLRDSNVIIINDGKTAHRPNAFEIFNNGIVMTNRTLKTNELFQVRLDLIIPKWAGSIEIGVTQHSLNDLEIPFRMSNEKSKTWAVTGEDVLKDGSVIIPQYVRNLNKLVEGDTVGVMLKDVGTLHFYINGEDQGPAAFSMPEKVYGIVDLYGRVAQATIVDSYTPPLNFTPDTPLSSESNAAVYPEMCFHRVHGRNARLTNNRLTATRATIYSEFNDAVLFSSRPLRECDMFELRIDRMVDCWIGNLEIGVTAIRPEDLEVNGRVGAIAGTATDLNWDTYILSGAAMMKDGECVRSGYPLDLDSLNVGSRVGIMWHADRSIHYYLDGMDMGKAWYVPHLNIYAVVDIYGQCTQVTIMPNEERAFKVNGCTNSDNSILSNSRALATPPYWSFSEYCGNNVSLKKNYSVASRLTADPMSALVFSSAHLALNEIFEIKIADCKSGFAGSFRMGVTDVNILNANVNRHMPPAISCLPHFTAYVDGRYMKYSRPGAVKEHDIISFVPSFEWLRPGDRVGLMKTADMRVIIYYNSEPLEIAFENVPDKVYVVMELYGPVTKIQAVTRGKNGEATQPTVPDDDECVEKPKVTKTTSAASAAKAKNVRSNGECNDIPIYVEAYTSNMTVEDDLSFYELAFHELPFNEFPFDDSPVNTPAVTIPPNEHLEEEPPVCESSDQSVNVESNPSNQLSDIEPSINRQTCDDPPYEDPPYEDPSNKEHPYDEPTYDDPTYDGPPFDNPPNDDTPYDDPPYDGASYDGPPYDEPLCYDPPCYDVPCYDTPSNGTPCNEPSFSEPSDKDAPHNVPPIKESQLNKPTNETSLNDSLNNEDSLYDINEPLSSKTPPIECFDEEGRSTSELPINESPVNDESSLNDLPFSDLSDNEAQTNDPLLLVSDSPGDQPQAHEHMNKSLLVTEQPLEEQHVLQEPLVEEFSINELPIDHYRVSEVLNDTDRVNELPIAKDRDNELPIDKGLIKKLPIDNDWVKELPNDNDQGNQLPNYNDWVKELPFDSDCVKELPFDNDWIKELPIDNDWVNELPIDNDQINELPIDNCWVKEALAEELFVVEGPVDKPVVSETTVNEPYTELSLINPPISDTQDTKAKITEMVAEPLATSNITGNTAPTESNSNSSVTSVASESRRYRRPLPYTFHYVHGKNIKLCSSDTVAVRTTGYKHGIAIVSQPLRRGNNFRFRIDKLAVDWVGGASIGAVGSLPSDDLPACALHLDPPLWIVSSEVLQDNGTMTTTNMACVLDELSERSVLTIHFKFNGELIIDVDSKTLGSIGTVPRTHPHVFPLIDLYGRVRQVSVLLHPYVIASGASLDLPIIAENHREESFADLEPDENEHSRADLTDPLIITEKTQKKNTEAYGHDYLLDDDSESIDAQPGPSTKPDLAQRVSLPFEKDFSNNEIKCRKIGPDHNEMVNRCLQKSHSTQSFRHVADENILPGEVRSALQHTFSASSGISDDDIVVHRFFDTNIHHNDQYPEANDVDNLDNEIIDALTLETGNLPDLTEEQSSSFDDSTRRDDYWSDSLAVENLNYLNRILCLDQDGADGQSLESEWEASGEGCEHLHLVLKYWNYLVVPYPELRQAVSWGQVRCYCSNCQSDAPDAIAGWVRIERIDGVGAAQRAFWHVQRSTLGSAQAVACELGPSRRPRSLAATPSTSPTMGDIWFDEEGKPHHTVLAIEIDIEGSDAEKDRLLAFYIYLKPNVIFLEDSPLSLDE